MQTGSVSLTPMQEAMLRATGRELASVKPVAGGFVACLIRGGERVEALGINPNQAVINALKEAVRR